jgi:hypothetical protein
VWEDVVYYVRACAELIGYTLVIAAVFATVEHFVRRSWGSRA